MKAKSSSGDHSKDRNKYLTDDFWINPRSHFWETGPYSEATKEGFRDWIREVQARNQRKSKENLITVNQTRR